MNTDVNHAIADRVRSRASTISVAVFAGAAGTVGSYAIAGDTPGFVAAPIAGFLARTLPGVVLTAAILLLGDLGQQLNLLTAVGLATAVFAILAGGGIVLGRRFERPLTGATVAGIASGAVAATVTGSPIPSIGTAIGVTLVVAIAEFDAGWGSPVTAPGRRHALKAIGTFVFVGLASVGLRRLSGGGGSGGGGSQGGGRQQPPGGAPLEDQEAIDALLSEADEKSLEIDGIEPLVSEAFYEVDISAVNPDIDAADWSLAFTGMVVEDRTIDYETLRDMPAEHRFVTLRCVGEELNGHKMDNALWTGVPVAPLLEGLSIESGCECVMLRAADDYYEEFPLEALRRGFLAWGMNGRELPRAHGHPVRALIPGHWGEINVKWLTEIEFLDRQVDGYWEERGWHGTGPVNTVAKLHAVDHRDDGTIQVAGHGYAGLRDIDAVEVSTDGGSTWNDATLTDRLPGSDVWRQWVYEYDSPGAPHEVVVRAIDGTGETQSAEESGPFPSGPSGWVRQQVRG